MLAPQLCKNIEGDAAKPGLAATTCWQRSQSMIYVSDCIRLGSEKVGENFLLFPFLSRDVALRQRSLKLSYSLIRNFGVDKPQSNQGCR